MLRQWKVLFLLIVLLLSACRKAEPTVESQPPALTEPASTVTASPPTETSELEAVSPAAASAGEAEPTRQPTATAPTPTLPAATPVPAEPTATALVEAAQPSPEIAVTLLPGVNGLTPEELVNQGTHKYKMVCQAWASCVCESAPAVSQVTILFTETAVNFTSSGGSSSFARQMSNVYGYEDAESRVQITFLYPGYEYAVFKAGSDCLKQTYTRDVSPP